jgi:hypothetical protein
MYFFWIIVLIVFGAIIVRFRGARTRSLEVQKLLLDEQSYKPHEVYCLMVTSNDEHRSPYCRVSVQNFLEQTYSRKHLVIVNLSEDPILSKEQRGDDRLLEVFFERNGLSLGAIRNISLELVPPNAWWTLWDDDDWRIDSYLQRLVDWSKGFDFVMIQNRIEFNTLNGYSYVLTLRSGLMSFFAKRIPTLRYEDLNTKEDVLVKNTALKELRCNIVDNAPALYVRMIHTTNTSPYANPSKKSLKDTSKNKNYFERNLRTDEWAYLDKILSAKYKYVIFTRPNSASKQLP